MLNISLVLQQPVHQVVGWLLRPLRQQREPWQSGNVIKCYMETDTDNHTKSY